jgi:hypothetical protein
MLAEQRAPARVLRSAERADEVLVRCVQGDRVQRVRAVPVQQRVQASELRRDRLRHWDGARRDVRRELRADERSAGVLRVSSADRDVRVRRVRRWAARWLLSVCVPFAVPADAVHHHGAVQHARRDARRAVHSDVRRDGGVLRCSELELAEPDVSVW